MACLRVDDARAHNIDRSATSKGYSQVCAQLRAEAADQVEQIVPILWRFRRANNEAPQITEGFVGFVGIFARVIVWPD